MNSQCVRIWKFGHARTGDSGRVLIGGFAQYCVLPRGTAIFRIPAGLPDVVAASANCAAATAAAVIRRAGPVAGEKVTVVGAGMLGLIASTMASAKGACEVVAIDPNPARRELAIAFGATSVADAAEGASARDADLVLEFAGSPSAVEAGFARLRPGGRMLLAGSVYPMRPVQLDPERIVRRMLTIQGVYNYEPQDLAEALGFLESKASRFPFESLVGERFDLKHINSAIDAAMLAKSPRIAVIP